MTAHAKAHGHPIIFRREKWVYADNRQPADTPRPCAHCGRMPTAAGHDACLGSIPGVISACCGHGHPEDRIMIKRKRPNEISSV